MGPQGSDPNRSYQSMASGLSSFEEEKVLNLDREISNVSSQPSLDLFERLAA